MFTHFDISHTNTTTLLFHSMAYGSLISAVDPGKWPWTTLCTPRNSRKTRYSYRPAISVSANTLKSHIDFFHYAHSVWTFSIVQSHIPHNNIYNITVSTMAVFREVRCSRYYLLSCTGRCSCRSHFLHFTNSDNLNLGWCQSSALQHRFWVNQHWRLALKFANLHLAHGKFFA